MADGWGALDPWLTVPQASWDFESVVSAQGWFFPKATVLSRCSGWTQRRLAPACGAPQVASRRPRCVYLLSQGRGEGPRETAPWRPVSSSVGALSCDILFCLLNE